MTTLPLAPGHPDYRGNLTLSDEQIMAFVSELRHTSYWYPYKGNPAADALTTLYLMVMEADTDDLEAMADEVAGEASDYARLQMYLEGKA